MLKYWNKSNHVLSWSVQLSIMHGVYDFGQDLGCWIDIIFTVY